MPNMNGKGPYGNGPKTGRGFGNCNSNLKEKTTTQIKLFGKGFGRRFTGRGRRF